MLECTSLVCCNYIKEPVLKSWSKALHKVNEFVQDVWAPVNIEWIITIYISETILNMYCLFALVDITGAEQCDYCILHGSVHCGVHVWVNSLLILPIIK